VKLEALEEPAGNFEYRFSETIIFEFVHHHRTSILLETMDGKRDPTALPVIESAMGEIIFSKSEAYTVAEALGKLLIFSSFVRRPIWAR
jgi:hypothetical protein